MLRLKRKNQGFTIIELLVAIVVIGILAAISVVVYSGIAGKAKDSAKETTTKQIQRKLLTNEVSEGSLLSGKVMTPSDLTRDEFMQEQGLSSLGDDVVVSRGSYYRGGLVKYFDMDNIDDYRKTTYSGNHEFYEYDKDKVFMSFGIEEYTTLTWPWDGKTDPVIVVNISRWSNKDGEWRILRILRYDSKTSRNEIKEESGCAPSGESCDYDPDYESS